MTKPEFDEWLAFHFSRFTGAASWLGKFPAKSRFVGDPTQMSTMEAWYGIVRACELKFAKEATQLLAIGQEEFSERGFDCHPRCVRAIAMKMGGVATAEARREIKFVGNEPVYDCGTCRDSGFVLLWHPSALKFFKKEFTEQPPRRLEKGVLIEDWNLWYFDERWRELGKRGRGYERCVARCTCHRGTNPSALPYDENKHVLFGDGDPRTAMESFALTPAGGSGLDGEF